MRPGELLLESIRMRTRSRPDRLREAWHSAADLSSLVAFEECAMFLHRRLATLGVRDTGPSQFGLWLARTAVSESARALLVDAEASRVAAFLERRSIPCVLLKGVARRVAGTLLPNGDARTTTDVDVLVPGGEARNVLRMFFESGYDYACEPTLTPAGHYHLPPVRRPGSVTVEIHTSISRRIPAGEAWRRFSTGGRQIDWNGVPTHIPSFTELLWHAVIHGVERGPEAFRLRYLLDAAIMLERADAVDWLEIVRRMVGGEVENPAHAGLWLRTAAGIAGVVVPGNVPASRLKFDLARALDWRFDVLQRTRAFPRFRQRLLAESTRSDLALPTEDPGPGISTLRRIRWKVVSRVARATYMAWRGTRPSDDSVPVAP